jgi:hypothetical protein
MSGDRDELRSNEEECRRLVGIKPKVFNRLVVVTEADKKLKAK